MYHVVVNLKHTPVASEKDAVKLLWAVMKKGIRDKTIATLQQIDACWIERNGQFWKNWYDARDYAYDSGWVVDGKWI